MSRLRYLKGDQVLGKQKARIEKKEMFVILPN